MILILDFAQIWDFAQIRTYFSQKSEKSRPSSMKVMIAQVNVIHIVHNGPGARLRQ